MYLKIKPLTSAISESYANHTSFHEGDSGIDLFTPERIIIPKDSLSNKIRLNICCEAFLEKDTDVNISYYLYPRSSTGSKTPLRLSNSVGIIDAGYRGEIMAIVDNLDRNNDYVIEAGTRLFQICSPNLSPISIEIVNNLSETSRGGGGFGSTGS